MPEKRKVSLPVGKFNKKLQEILLLLRIRGEAENTRREFVSKLCQLQYALFRQWIEECYYFFKLLLKY